MHLASVPETTYTSSSSTLLLASSSWLGSAARVRVGILNAQCSKQWVCD